MGERERALERDRQARLRLAQDAVFKIKQKRVDGHTKPHYESRRRALADCPLTPSELEVLRCRSRSLTNQMTADSLGRSPETVKTQLRNARTKLGTKDTTGACCEAIRRGLIP